MIAALLVVMLCTSLRAEEKVKADPARFEKETAAYEAADKKAAPPQGAVLFYGASGIRMWKTLKEDFPDQKVINRGFGGSQISDCIVFADRVVLPYKPKLIVFQAGGNDINAGKSPETAFADYKTFVEKVHTALPETRIAFFGQGPSPSRWAQAEKQQKLNAMVKAYSEKEKNLVFIEGWDAFLGKDGKPREELFIADKLHHNAEGYKIRVKLVKPILAKSE